MKYIFYTPIVFLLSCVLLPAFPYTVTDGYNLKLDQSFERTWESNLDQPGGGDVTIDRSRTALSHDQDWREGYFNVSLFYEHTDYDYSDPNSEIIGTGRNWGLELAVLQHISNDWSAVGRFEFESAKESDADFSESFIYSFMVGGAYQFSDTFSVTYGLFYQTELEDYDFIFPFLAVDWQISDRMNLKTANGVFVDYDLFGDDRSLF